MAVAPTVYVYLMRIGGLRYLIVRVTAILAAIISYLAVPMVQTIVDQMVLSKRESNSGLERLAAATKGWDLLSRLSRIGGGLGKHWHKGFNPRTCWPTQE
jgi:hypothetical protein